MKFKIKLTMHKLFFLASIFLACCAYAKEKNCNAINSTQAANALNAPKLVKMMSVEAADCHAISIHGDALAFHLSEHSPKIHNGIRSEVAINYPYAEHDHVTYVLDIQLPSNFKADVGQNRWWLVTQWHDQPNPTLGENWHNFPKLSPPVAIYLEERNGVIGMGLVMFGKEKKSWFPFPLGEWLTLSITFDWSTEEDGNILFKIAHHPELDLQVSGRNMNNAYQHYLKFGQYRHPDIKANTTIFVKNLNIY